MLTIIITLIITLKRFDEGLSYLYIAETKYQ